VGRGVKTTGGKGRRLVESLFLISDLEEKCPRR
jgi:hypothetical protein